MSPAQTNQQKIEYDIIPHVYSFLNKFLPLNSILIYFIP